jgi:orotidine-5'-phosphate decarboxylase
MTKAFAAEYPVKNLEDRIIVALDVATAAEAREVVAELGDAVGAFKIGSQLFTAAGPSLVREFVEVGHRIFLDLKFHDIPNTVSHAAVEAARLGVWMFNVHALGGREMMERTTDAVRNVCEKESLPLPLVIAVTILTSVDDAALSEIGIDATAQDEIVRLSRLTADSGLDGVVASPHESVAIRSAISRPDFAIVTPGIRPMAATSDDQKRVTSIADAFANGSDFVVIGRPILAAVDKRKAVEELIEEATIK